MTRYQFSVKNTLLVSTFPPSSEILFLPVTSVLRSSFSYAVCFENNIAPIFLDVTGSWGFVGDKFDATRCISILCSSLHSRHEQHTRNNTCNKRQKCWGIPRDDSSISFAQVAPPPLMRFVFALGNLAPEGGGHRTKAETFKIPAVNTYGEISISIATALIFIIV